jgi:hypothetical protein
MPSRLPWIRITGMPVPVSETQSLAPLTATAWGVEPGIVASPPGMGRDKVRKGLDAMQPAFSFLQVDRVELHRLFL